MVRAKSFYYSNLADTLIGLGDFIGLQPVLCCSVIQPPCSKVAAAIYNI